MKLLIFGKSGQVAQALKLACENNGYEAIFFGRTDIDISNIVDINKLLDEQKPDGVINASAYTLVDRAETEIFAAYRLNAIAPAIIASACASVEVPYIHISTDYVFDGKKSGEYNECDLICPISVYGRSKAVGETEVLAQNQNAMIMRTSWVYHESGNNFLKTMLKLGNQHETLKVVGDQFGSPTYAGDIADALLAMMQKSFETGDCAGIYHFSGSGMTNWHEFATAIFEKSKEFGIKSPVNVLNIPSSEYPTPVARPENSKLSSKKFTRIFGLTPPHWKNSMVKCLDKLLQV